MRRIASSRLSSGATVSAGMVTSDATRRRGLLPGLTGQPAEVGDRDDADQPALVVHHRKIGERAGSQVLQQLAEGRGLARDLWRRVERVRHPETREHVPVGAVLEPLAAAAEPPAVERVGLQPARHQIGDHRGQHEGEDDPVVVGHLEDEQHAGDGRAGGRRHHRAHAHQRVGLRPEPEVGKEAGERHAEGATGRGPDVERGSEHAARPAEVERDRSGEDASQGEQRERGPRHPAEHLEVHREVAVSDQHALGEEHQHAHQEAAEKCQRPARPLGLAGEGLHGEEHPHEEHTHQSGDEAEEGVENHQLALERVAVLLGNREGGVVAQEAVGDHRGHHAGHHDRREGADRERAQNLLQREEGAGQRGIEGGRDTGRRPGRHHDLGTGRVEPECAAEKRGQRGAQHGHRAFAARRASAAQGHRARGGAGQRRAHRQAAALARDRTLDVRDIEPFVSPSRAAHDQVRERHPEPGEQGPIREDPRLGQEDRGGEIEDPVGEIDQPVERHHAEPARQADGHGKAEQDGVFVEMEGVEPVGELVPDPARAPGSEAGRVSRRSSGIGQRGKPSHGYLRKHCTKSRLTSVFPSTISPRSISREHLGPAERVQLHELVGLPVLRARLQSLRHEEMDPLVGEARRSVDGGEPLQPSGAHAGFLFQLPPGAAPPGSRPRRAVRRGPPRCSRRPRGGTGG